MQRQISAIFFIAFFFAFSTVELAADFKILGGSVKNQRGDSGPVNFDTDNDGIAEIVMDVNGNLGLGTTTPSANLHLTEGNVLITSGNAAIVPMQIVAASGQSVNLAEWQNAAGEITAITSNGNLAIGTSSTTRALRVRSSSPGRNGMLIENSQSSGDPSYLFGVGTASTGSNGNFVLWNDGSGAVLLSMTSAGVTSFSGELQGKNAAEMNILSQQSTTGAGNRGIVLGRTSSAGGLRWTSGTGSLVRVGNSSVQANTGVFNPSTGNAKMIWLEIAGTINQSGSADGDYSALSIDITESSFTGNTGRLIEAGVGGALKFVVENSGNVGVGTSVPLQILHAAGNVQIDSVMSLAEIASAPATSTGNGQLYTIGDNLYFKNSSGTATDITGEIASSWTASAGNVYRSSGLVGIGTATPTDDLHVEGGLTVTGSSNMGAPLKLSDGSLSSPALAFQNDTDTGLYLSATGNMTFLTGGANAILVDSDKNVGIGTTVANAKLHVEGFGDASTVMMLRSKDAGGGGKTSVFQLRNSFDHTAEWAIQDNGPTAFFGLGGGYHFTYSATGTSFVYPVTNLTGSTGLKVDYNNVNNTSNTTRGIEIEMSASNSVNGYDGLYIDITDDGSNAAGNRYFINAELGGDQKFHVERSGNLYISGNAGIGVSNPTNGLEVAGNVMPGGNALYDIGAMTTVWRNVYAKDYTMISDRRLKENVSEISYGIDAVRKIKPVSYSWKGESSREVSLGFIAQDLREVVGEVVKEDRGPDKLLGVHYSNLIPVLVKAMQEQDGTIQRQKKLLNSQNDELKRQAERIDKLESAMEKWLKR